VPKATAQPGANVLEVDNLLVADNQGLPAVIGTTFEVRANEILGIAGVSGNGQTELIEAIAGMRPIDAGQVRLLGHNISQESVSNRREAGMAHIPEDRLTTGLNLRTNLDENVVVTNYNHEPYSERGFMQLQHVRDLARSLVQKFNIRSARVGEEIHTLSGGNLQKIVLGRELEGSPQFIIANQPTRGVDVGSIEFVHQTLVTARDAGAAILLVSVDLDEILALSDRIAVMYAGRIMGILDSADANEEDIGILMVGGSLQHDKEITPAS
jgi:simple sugar transport system ATP-binding protein